jgi:RNA polymerase sigma-70 factor, ECF subfamily
MDFVRRTASRADADDVVQECFLRAIRTPPRSHPRAWLYRVAVNVLRDQARRERTSRDALPELGRMESATETDPASCAEARNLVEHARGAVAQLSERQRLCLYLRLQRHMDYDEIGLVLECSADTARQHFYLAVKNVRDRLGEVRDG